MTREPSACRAILHDWRAHPRLAFGDGFERASEMASRITAAAAVAAIPAGVAERLLDGIVVRVGRGDPEDAILAWAVKFADRRKVILSA